MTGSNNGVEANNHDAETEVKGANYTGPAELTVKMAKVNPYG